MEAVRGSSTRPSGATGPVSRGRRVCATAKQHISALDARIDIDTDNDGDGQRVQTVWLRFLKLDTVSTLAMSLCQMMIMTHMQAITFWQREDCRCQRRRAPAQPSSDVSLRMASCSAPTRVQPKATSSPTRTAKRCVSASPSFRRPSIPIPCQIHYISESIRCCGAGTAADTEFVTAMISSNMELHALSTGRKPHVVTAMTMLKQHLYKYVYPISFSSETLSPRYQTQDTKGRSVRRSFSEVSTPPVHSSLRSIPTVRQTSCRT